MLERLKRLFDLRADPAAISLVLGKVAEPRPGLRLPGSFDGFEMAVRAILGQQISVAAASTLAGRLALRYGEPIQTPFAALTRLFPTPQRLASATVPDIGRLGITGQRAKTLIALSRAVVGRRLHLEPGSRIEDTFEELGRIPGIGDWTSQYIAMRALRGPMLFRIRIWASKKPWRWTHPKENSGTGREMAALARLRHAASLGRFN